MRSLETPNLELLDNDSMEFIDAAACDDLERARRYLDNGIHPDTQGAKGWNGLRKAAVKNSYHVALELLTRGASVDATNYTGQTPLMMACAYGHPDMVSLFLFFGADPNRTNSGGSTPLMMAAEKGLVRIVGILLDAYPRVDLDKTDSTGRNALDMAMEYQHVAVVNLLLAAGASRRSGRQVGMEHAAFPTPVERSLAEEVAHAGR